ncbi:ABC transporter ATP-binding protein [Nonomuraea typhae]|uniref:ABC transporter ATP-binding protein n=1 Tax=Nonomuraea typhae TaxID=2603600 RepID=UPI0012FC552E|nr:ABC transporter ATP-binding protein [Nonomuraea typhae]
MAVLTVDGLRKSYHDLVAVDGLGFAVWEGETYGLLGPNGAGKTTAISMIVGILAPDAGSVRAPDKAAIGYVPQELALYPDLTGRENLRFFCGMYGMRRAAAKARTTELLATVGLSDRADKAVATYSGGMQRRLNIAIGLLNRPRLLVLDEPTAGVDPQSRNAILDSVRRLTGEGLAVLYTTHYMEEAQRLCDRVGILDHGRLLAEGSPDELGEPDLEAAFLRLTGRELRD